MTSRHYAFTIFVLDEKKNLIEFHPEKFKYMKDAFWQVERGEANGTLHYQCHFDLTQPVRASAIVKCFALPEKSYRFQAVKGSVDNIRSRRYCAKTESRVMGPFEWHRDQASFWELSLSELRRRLQLRVAEEIFIDAEVDRISSKVGVTDLNGLRNRLMKGYGIPKHF